MKTQPFLLGEDTNGHKLRSVEEGSGHYNEGWLQSVLHKHPEILPTGSIEFVYAPMISLGREISTKAGPIDNLFISQQGYLTLVETKLWRNPEARREVVAQAMDYAHALAQWSYEDLEDATARVANKGRGPNEGIFQAVERQLGSTQGGRDFFIETVEENLRLGRFLVLIVGDKIRESVVDIASFVNRYPGLALTMALVELQCFHLNKEGGWPLVLVPRVLKRSKIVERSVVEAMIVDGKATRVEVSQRKTATPEDGRSGGVLTEDAFWSLMKKQAGENFAVAKELIDKVRDRPGIVVDPGQASLAVKYEDQGSGRLISLFFVHNKGNLGVWPETLERQVADIELPAGAVTAYVEGARKALHMPQARREFACALKSVDLNVFGADLDRLLKVLQQKSS